MEDLIIVVILAVVIFAAARFVYKEKKRGVKCVGCPDGGCNCQCEGGCAGCGSAEMN